MYLSPEAGNEHVTHLHSSFLPSLPLLPALFISWSPPICKSSFQLFPCNSVSYLLCLPSLQLLFPFPFVKVSLTPFTCLLFCSSDFGFCYVRNPTCSKEGSSDETRMGDLNNPREMMGSSVNEVPRTHTDSHISAAPVGLHPEDLCRNLKVISQLCFSILLVSS